MPGAAVPENVRTPSEALVSVQFCKLGVKVRVLVL